jgi:peptidoglycan hydrolase CwlO-like protein
MTIPEFYSELVGIMTNYESQYDSLKEAKNNLKALLAKAKKEKLKHINVTEDIFEDIELKPESSYDQDSSMIC